jgi:ribosomal protein S18 acetylase RimI-like enzyme
MQDLHYKMKEADEADILVHLQACDANFSPPLSQRVALEGYSKKIHDLAVTFEAWIGTTLAGLVAMYVDTDKQMAFITNVSVLKGFMGRGMAADLVREAIDYCKHKKINVIRLEVTENNGGAIRLYEKFNFMKYDRKDNLYLMKLEIIEDGHKQII